MELYKQCYKLSDFGIKIRIKIKYYSCTNLQSIYIRFGRKISLTILNGDVTVNFLPYSCGWRWLYRLMVETNGQTACLSKLHDALYKLANSGLR